MPWSRCARSGRAAWRRVVSLSRSAPCSITTPASARPPCRTAPGFSCIRERRNHRFPAMAGSSRGEVRAPAIRRNFSGCLTASATVERVAALRIVLHVVVHDPVEAAVVRTDPRRIAHHHRAGRHRACDYRAGKDVGVVADRDLADDHGAGADEYPVADGRAAALIAAPGDAEGHVLLDGAVVADRA